MIVRTRIFELCHKDYKNLSELAGAMDISISQVYRVREGKRSINRQFFVGAIKAFPMHKLDDLFYLAPEPAAEQRMESIQQTLKRVDSAIGVCQAPQKSH